MQVTVVSGSGLKGDLLGAPDVYVVLKHAGQVQKTTVVNSKDPVWRQSFQMVANTQNKGGYVLGKGTLEVDVWDKDKIGKDDFLGAGSIDLEPLEWNRTTVKVIDLKKGQITMEIKPTDFGIGKRAGDFDTPGAGAGYYSPQAPSHAQISPSPHHHRAAFPVYRGPYRANAEDYESRYFVSRGFAGTDDVEARRVNDLEGFFPSYHGQGVPGRTPTSQFHPLPDFPADEFVGGRPKPSAASRDRSESHVEPHHRERRSHRHHSGTSSYGAGGQHGSASGGMAADRGIPASGGGGGGGGSGGSGGTASSSTLPPGVAPKKHPDIGTLHITVLKAIGLRAPIDAAVRLKIEDKKIETTIKKETQAPQWSESFKFFVRLNQGNKPGVRLGRTATMPLQVTLLDKKTNDEVGSTMVSLQELYEGKGTEVQGAQLKDKAGNVMGEITLTLKPLAFGLKFYKGKLRCRVLHAAGLKMVGGADPEAFVVLKLREEKQTTRVAAKSRNPEWEEDLVFAPDVYEKKGVVQCSTDLQVDVFGKTAMGEEKLGSGTIPLASLVQKRPQRQVVDLLENGKLYLELEADNFGIISDEPAPPPQPSMPSSGVAHGQGAGYAQQPPGAYGSGAYGPGANRQASSGHPAYGQAPHGQYGPGPYGQAAYGAGAYGASSYPSVERPVLPGHPMPPSATLPMVPLAGPNSRWTPLGLPPLDPDDATIASLKEELHRLQRQSSELEHKNSSDVAPLQSELNVVRAQLERALHQVDRLHSEDTHGRRRHTSSGSSSRRSRSRSRSYSPDHSTSISSSVYGGYGAGRVHPEARPYLYSASGVPPSASVPQYPGYHAVPYSAFASPFQLPQASILTQPALPQPYPTVTDIMPASPQRVHPYEPIPVPPLLYLQPQPQPFQPQPPVPPKTSLGRPPHSTAGTRRPVRRTRTANRLAA